jgi:aspartyl-tRNA(Asn)/glutamyl-tRNA(Gln) amidotransferase subunit B
MASIVSTQLKIGMEIHVELATRSKMFTRAANVAHPAHYDAEPNSLVDAVVLALPGTLPVMNRRAVEMSIMVGLALGCDIARESKWDRKNYFYPDLPKGYQISQYDLPLCFDGELAFVDHDGTEKAVGIIRAHLEEDAGKLGHELPGGAPSDGTLVDLNRAGTPLLEIVTHPDLTSADDAVIFAQELRNICRFLGVTEGVMQRGHMRFEPNINVIIHTDDGRVHATPIVEIKNLNSFRSLRGAIEHEYARQIDEWKETGQVMGRGLKSTRGWDDAREVTFLQRAKEDEHDYRYFPEPDLPPVIVSDEWRERIRAAVPELPIERQRRYMSAYELSRKDAQALTAERGLCYFFEACMAAIDETTELAANDPAVGRQCAKLLLNAGAKRANERNGGIDELGISPAQIAALIELRERNLVGSTAAETLFDLLCETNDDARNVAEAHGLLQVRDDSQLDAWIEAAIKAEPKSAEDFAAGKDAAIGRLMGAVMKTSSGAADAKAVREKLIEKLRR